MSSIWGEEPIQNEHEHSRVLYWIKEYDEYIAKGGTKAYTPRLNAAILQEIVEYRTWLINKANAYAPR